MNYRNRISKTSLPASHISKSFFGLMLTKFTKKFLIQDIILMIDYIDLSEKLTKHRYVFEFVLC